MNIIVLFLLSFIPPGDLAFPNDDRPVPEATAQDYIEDEERWQRIGRQMKAAGKELKVINGKEILVDVKPKETSPTPTRRVITIYPDGRITIEDIYGSSQGH